jgi:hypothetical protein
LSEICSKAQAGTIPHYPMPNSKSGFYECDKSGRVFYRSSWELIFATFLCANDLVDMFFMEIMVVPYTNESGLKRFTRPDFFINFTNNNCAIVEVKPSGLIVRNKFKLVGQASFCLSKKMGYAVVSDMKYNNLEFVIQKLYNGENVIPSELGVVSPRG